MPKQSMYMRESNAVTLLIHFDCFFGLLLCLIVRRLDGTKRPPPVAVTLLAAGHWSRRTSIAVVFLV